MCEFCRNLKEWKDIDSESTEIRREYEVCLVRVGYRSGNKPCSVYRDRRQKLVYCPECGRKLAKQKGRR